MKEVNLCHSFTYMDMCRQRFRFQRKVVLKEWWSPIRIQSVIRGSTVHPS